MNKRNKIIVSIVGITIVLLALLGITYAYYLTRIEGNTNTNSISITTADLKLVYSENSPEIVTENNIMPGTTIGEKKFTVSNTGNSAVEDYKVVLEYAVIENVVPSLFVRPQDFEITMTCVSKNIETNEESGTCSGYTGTWNNESFEMTTNDIAENIKHEYSLTIVYVNQETIDQSDDMGKNLNLKVQIYGANETSTITGTIDNVDETYAMKLNSNPKISTIKKIIDSEGTVKYQYKFIGVEHNSGDDSHTLTLVNKSNVEQSTGNITIKKGTNANISGSTITVKDNQTNIFLTTSKGESLTSTATFNPYSDNTNTLAYHIINNAMNKTNGTELLDKSITTPAEETSAFKYIDGKDLQTETVYNYWKGSTTEYYTYGDTYEFNEDTGKYTIKNSNGSAVKTVKGFSTLVGKYIVDTSPSTSSVAVSASKLNRIYYVVSVDSTWFYYITLTSSGASNEKYYTYGDTYEFNENTGKYTIKNRDGSSLQVVKYNTNYETLKNKYIVSLAGSTTSTPSSGENKSKIYKVSNNSTSELLKYYTITKEEISLENILVTAPDNYGVSYYYRGGVKDNYVSFNNMCWRIVRVEGDGSIKLILESQNACSEGEENNYVIGRTEWGYKVEENKYIGDYKNSTTGMKNLLNTWFDTYFKSDGNLINEGLKLKDEEWCLGNGTDAYNYSTPYELLETPALENYFSGTKFYYETGRNLYGKGVTQNATLKCNGEKDISKIGALTADEVVFAGGKAGNTNINYYLYKTIGFWTLSLGNYDGYADIPFYEQSGSLYTNTAVSINDMVYIRPAVTLKAGTIITGGEGTIDRPYIIA